MLRPHTHAAGTLGALAAGLVVAGLLAAPPAAALSSNAAQVNGTTLVYQAGSGNTNDVIVDLGTLPGSEVDQGILISDDFAITPGPGCQFAFPGLSTTAVFCDVPSATSSGIFLTEVQLTLGDLNDQLTVNDNTPVPVTAYGQGGDDVLLGGLQADLLDGGIGNDTLSGDTGDDTLIGSYGQDTLNGDAGDDTLEGGPGPDELHGGSDLDHLDGGVEDDDLFGEAGNDTLVGYYGNDYLNGGPGFDRFSGGLHADRINSVDGTVAVDEDPDCGGGTDKVFADALDDPLANCETVDRF